MVDDTRRLASLLLGGALVALVVAGCSNGDDGVTVGVRTVDVATSGPTTTRPAPTVACATVTVGGPNPSNSDILAGLEELGVASTIRPIDDSTSVVIDVDLADQILCQPEGPRLVRDVTYATVTATGGGSLDLRMDVLVPDGERPLPLVVFVTGGGFATADRRNSLDKRTYLSEAGFVVASIEYRTIGAGIYHDGVEDVKAAVRYLRAHADDFRIEPESVAVWGESAGGYLAAMTGVTNGLKEYETGPDLDEASDVQAVVDAYGLSDLRQVAADYDPDSRLRHLTAETYEARYLHGANSGLTVLDVPEAAVHANPITYVDADDPPFLLLHGREDPLVSPSQTLLLHTALRDAGARSTRYAITGAGHASDHFATREVMDLVVAFLDAALR